MKKVRLLLSGQNNMQNYVDAVTAAGGEATAKYLPEISTDYDGLILCGGSDMDPKYYHEEINGAVGIDRQRDAVEFALLKAFVDAGKPVLGICKGHQVINVFFGGSLHQDIPEKKLHTSGQGFDLIHPVCAAEGSMLYALYGPSFVVNSSHHQAVKCLGSGLRATALWGGHNIEAFEHCIKPVYGVQFHPERMSLSKQRADTIDGMRIFRWFIRLCQENYCL